MVSAGRLIWYIEILISGAQQACGEIKAIQQETKQILNEIQRGTSSVEQEIRDLTTLIDTSIVATRRVRARLA